MSKHIVIRELIASSTYHPVDRNGKVDYEDVVMANDEPFVGDYIAVMREDDGVYEIVEDGFKTLDEAWTACDKYNGEGGEELYICVDDYQGTGFHIGDTQTAEGWRENALMWADADDFGQEAIDHIKSMAGYDLLDYIQDMWQIHIVEFEPKNSEHIKLRQEYENND